LMLGDLQDHHPVAATLHANQSRDELKLN